MYISWCKHVHLFVTSLFNSQVVLIAKPRYTEIQTFVSLSIFPLHLDLNLFVFSLLLCTHYSVRVNTNRTQERWALLTQTTGYFPVSHYGD